MKYTEAMLAYAMDRVKGSVTKTKIEARLRKDLRRNRKKVLEATPPESSIKIIRILYGTRTTGSGGIDHRPAAD